jgi:hypothetical protein
MPQLIVGDLRRLAVLPTIVENMILDIRVTFSWSLTNSIRHRVEIVVLDSMNEEALITQPIDTNYSRKKRHEAYTMICQNDHTPNRGQFRRHLELFHMPIMSVSLFVKSRHSTWTVHFASEIPVMLSIVSSVSHVSWRMMKPIQFR